MTSNPSQPNREPPEASAGPGRRELILIGAADAGLRISATEARSVNGSDLGPLAAVAAAPDVVIRPLFGPSEERVRAAADGPQEDELTDRMSRCYHVDAPDDRLEDLAGQLRGSPAVEGVYIKPAADLAVLTQDVGAEQLNLMAPTGADAPPVTPDFSDRQGYLGAAPGGIEARWAWTQPGGRGAGVRVVDCEWGWRFTHEDLSVNQGGVIAGTTDPDPESRTTSHGTAVLGEISGDVNGIGIVGIASDAVISASSFSQPTATAIRAAADRLGPGDIILLEIHRAGPRHPAGDLSQFGYIAVEWWPDDYLAIRYAVNRGIIVVEAAGNGSQNLDERIYDAPRDGFPGWWRNPFRRGELDSGAVVVGAGSPPGAGAGSPDRSRLGFSNHGACVDAQGWGRDVVTTGYGDLQRGHVDLWYTSSFSGTSSASPIVVGALACVQGILRAHGRPRLSPARARELLRATGSPQQDAPDRPATERIGNRPNLRQLVAVALQNQTWTGVQFRGQIPARGTQRWFTFRWPAHWHVLWTVMPTSPRPGAPQLRYRTRVERASDPYATYWIEIVNLVDTPVDFEGRFAVLGW